jgi:hypothetical protein
VDPDRIYLPRSPKGGNHHARCSIADKCP